MTLDGEWKSVEGATAAEKAAMRFFKVVVEVLLGGGGFQPRRDSKRTQQVVALPAATSAALEAEKVAEPDECVEIAFGLDEWGEFPVIDKRPAK